MNSVLVGVRPIPPEIHPNRFAASSLEYLGELPGPEVELSVYEDHTKDILSENDSPDIGFRFSVNPYRGCFHGCAYCLAGDTQILMADGSTKQLADVRAGDQVYGTRLQGDVRSYTPTRVLDQWATAKRAYRVKLGRRGIRPLHRQRTARPQSGRRNQ